MFLTRQKFIDILLNECESIEEKCDGYKERLAKTVVEIIEIEKRHSVQGTNIRQQITAICEKTGDFLAENQDTAKTAKGDNL